VVLGGVKERKGGERWEFFISRGSLSIKMREGEGTQEES